MIVLATPDQVRAIHVLKSRAGLDEDMYRDALGRIGVVSSKELTRDQAAEFIQRLARDAGESAPSTEGAMRLDGPYAGKLRALWIVGYDCGVMRDRTDRALVAFLERQTSLSHTRFLREPADAKRAIEALKGWLTREAKIDWTLQPRAVAALEYRIAVLKAQWDKLIDLGVAHRDAPQLRYNGLWAYASKVATGSPFKKSMGHHFSHDELDKIRTALGRKIRKALAQ